MAKVYGKRWQVIGSLASGGQAEVFKVRDLAGEHPDELVLKRVRNPKRHDRFRSEVEAIKRLAHPNVISLIDHSALDADEGPTSKQFIVMPWAREGDLSKRRALYKGNVDSTLLVARSLAAALDAAHVQNIVHRDVKPENVLFPDIGHDIWLSDFGICLLRGADRNTIGNEVVGPVQFMAPELEDGGQLDVKPAADIYSLGKVIYYMLSGGIILPRERLNDSEHASVFATGERQRLLHILLSRMICPLERRLDSMHSVIAELDRIADWERSARLLALSSSALAKLDALAASAMTIEAKKNENASRREQRKSLLTATEVGALDWFFAEFEKLAGKLNAGNGLSAGVRRVAPGKNDVPRLSGLHPQQAVELWFRNKHAKFGREHLLRFSICSHFTITGRVASGGTEFGMEHPDDEPLAATVFILPAYGVMQAGSVASASAQWQLFTAEKALYQPSGSVSPSSSVRRTHQYEKPVKLTMLKFSTDDWPGASTHFSEFLRDLNDRFVAEITNTAPRLPLR